MIACHVARVGCRHGKTLLNDDASIKIRWKERIRGSPEQGLHSWDGGSTSTSSAANRGIIQHEKGAGQHQEEEKQQSCKNDRIPSEILEAGGQNLLCDIHALLLKLWHKEEIPAELRDALIVSIFNKIDKAICGHYHGISVLSYNRLFIRKHSSKVSEWNSHKQGIHCSSTPRKTAEIKSTTINTVYRSQLSFWFSELSDSVKICWPDKCTSMYRDMKLCQPQYTLQNWAL